MGLYPNKTCFERAIFFSWGCSIGDCKFCYMSTQPKDKKPTETLRSRASILAEVILAKELGWEIGFVTGGIGAMKISEMKDLLREINAITEKKVWLSAGPLSLEVMKQFIPYIKGIVGSIETVNPELHKKVCPSKPMEPYLKMFEESKKLNLARAITFIVGMGETKEDFILLKEFINKYGISKIHVYGLIPVKGTDFENFKIPTIEDQCWWIAKLREDFRNLDIQAGIWDDRVDRVSDLLIAGADSISKFKALKLFGSRKAEEIENQALIAGRNFQGTLTKRKEIKIDIYSLPIKMKLEQYINSFGKAQKTSL
jgi:biotin synthase-like enzyme